MFIKYNKQLLHVKQDWAVTDMEKYEVVGKQYSAHLWEKLN